jgi:hypothetical protein
VQHCGILHHEDVANVDAVKLEFALHSRLEKPHTDHLCFHRSGATQTALFKPSRGCQSQAGLLLERLVDIQLKPYDRIAYGQTVCFCLILIGYLVSVSLVSVSLLHTEIDNQNQVPFLGISEHFNNDLPHEGGFYDTGSFTYYTSQNICVWPAHVLQRSPRLASHFSHSLQRWPDLHHLRTVRKDAIFPHLLLGFCSSLLMSQLFLLFLRILRQDIRKLEKGHDLSISRSVHGGSGFTFSGGGRQKGLLSNLNQARSLRASIGKGSTKTLPDASQLVSTYATNKSHIIPTESAPVLVLGTPSSHSWSWAIDQPELLHTTTDNTVAQKIKQSCRKLRNVWKHYFSVYRFETCIFTKVRYT